MIAPFQRASVLSRQEIVERQLEKSNTTYSYGTVIALGQLRLAMDLLCSYTYINKASCSSLKTGLDQGIVLAKVCWIQFTSNRPVDKILPTGRKAENIKFIVPHEVGHLASAINFLSTFRSYDQARNLTHQHHHIDSKAPGRPQYYLSPKRAVRYCALVDRWRKTYVCTTPEVKTRDVYSSFG